MTQDYVSRIRQLFKQAKNRSADFEPAITEGMKALESIRAERAQLKDQERELERLIAGAQSIVAFLQELSGEKPAEAASEQMKVQSPVRFTPRVEAILEAATYLVEQGAKTIDVKDVHNELKRRGIDLEVAYPSSVIGTVLARDSRFSKVRPGVFEWKANAEPHED